MYRIKKIILISVLISSLSYAEEDNLFYEKDFAKNPLGQSVKEPIPKNRSRDDSILNKDEYTNKEEQAEKLNEQSKIDTQNNELYGYQINTISLILNTLDKNHAEIVLGNLIKLLNANNLKLQKIYLINYNNEIDAQKYFLPLMIYNPQYEYVDQIPEKYNYIKNSPTWIIETMQNDKPVEILLEGKLDLSKHITSKGLFVENGIPEKPKPKESLAPPQSF